MCVSGSKNHGARRHGRGTLVAILLFALFAQFDSPARADTAGDEHRVHDLYYGESLYYFFQQQELAAITRLMTAAERPVRAPRQADESRLLLADLFYSYGLYEESRSMFAQLLNAEVSASIQNRIWFNLARLRYEQGYHEQARDLLSRIDDSLPRHIESERLYLLASLHLGNRQYRQAAEAGAQIDADSTWSSYANYNLGIALLEDNDFDSGRQVLEELGQMEPQNPEELGLRDLANLSLSLKQLRLGQPEAALQTLSRVRLEGPFSNQALLATGWGWFALERYDKALVPWRVLLQRNAIDAATQEAILAIPANYAQSGDDQQAIRYYKIAEKQFELQLESLQRAIESINRGELIAALHESALLQDRGNTQQLPPITGVTPQLHLLLASNEFHRQLKRYQELLDIRRSLGHWGTSFPALELMLDERRQAFDQRLPTLRQSGSFERFEQLGQRRDQFAARLEAIESSEDFHALANAEERDHLERLQRVSASIDKLGTTRDTASQQDKQRLLSGMLDYRLATEFPARLWKARKQLIHLDRALNEAQARVLRLGQITERTTADFADFQRRIRGQSDKIAALRLRVDDLLQQQEGHINKLGIDALDAQQLHVEQLRLNARFELARIYDKLTVTQ